MIVISNLFSVVVRSSSPSPCSAGSYSLGSSTSCTACPAGYQCPNASATPEACGAGTYSLGSQTACTGCPAGQACPSTTTATVAYACSAGRVLCLHFVLFYFIFLPCFVPRMPVLQAECCFCTLVFVCLFFYLVCSPYACSAGRVLLLHLFWVVVFFTLFVPHNTPRRVSLCHLTAAFESGGTCSTCS